MSVDVFEAFSREQVRSALFGQSPRPVTVGRFALLEKLGSGAAGSVFATYDSRLDRKIAIKVLHATAIDATATDHLAAEARALAKLSHPNVVNVHDVGVEQGRVFIAMELVDGATLTDWLRAQPRTWNEIVDALADAGEGLAAAHEAGLVHRDFKPDHVIIDADGRVRIVDFGLAQRAEDGVAVPSASVLDRPVTKRTATVDWNGTPAYMSPEQFDGIADARADQFAFAVTLYEALFGSRPFQGDAIGELLNELRSRRPRVPGGRVPRHIGQALLRALAADPDDRFESMRAFVTALRQRPDRRLRRAAVLSVIAASAAATVAAWAYRPSPCPDPQHELADVWNDARATQVRGALAETRADDAPAIFSSVRAQLDAYAERWRQDRTENCRATRVDRRQSSRVEALRNLCLARRRRALDAFVGVLLEADDAVAQQARVAVRQLPGLDRCRDVEALLAAVPPPADADLRRRTEALRAQMIDARNLELFGRRKASLQTAAAVYEASKDIDYRPLRAEAAIELGGAQLQNGAYDDGERHLVEGIETALAIGHLRAAADAWQQLIWMYATVRSDFDRAELVAKQARAALSGMPGEQRLYASAVGKLGWLYGRMGRFAEAETLQQKALELRVKAYGEEHPFVAYSSFFLANLYLDVGDYDRADAMYGRTIELFQRLELPEHTYAAAAAHQRGKTLILDRRPEAARPYLERAIAAIEKRDGPKSLSAGATWLTAAKAALASGALRDAEASLDRAQVALLTALSRRHPDYGWWLCVRGELDLREGKRDQARQRFEEAKRILTESGETDHDAAGCPDLGIGRVALAEKRFAVAREHFDRSLALCGERFGRTHPILFPRQAAAARAALGEGDSDAAARYAAAALEIARDREWSGQEVDALRSMVAEGTP